MPKTTHLFVFFAFLVLIALTKCTTTKDHSTKRNYNGQYSGPHLNRVAFPIGGIGAGMVCLEGTGAISHVSVRNQPEVFNEPCTFAAISVNGVENGAKVLEGPVPGWKIYGSPGASLFCPVSLKPGEQKIVRLMFAWYVPETDLRTGKDIETGPPSDNDETACCSENRYHVPWYAARFENINEVVDYWRSNYDKLFQNTKLFSDTFYDTSLPDEVVEAVAANRCFQIYAASDEQLGGIMKVYREWRISGNNDWLKKIWPNVKQSLEYCIDIWDPRGRGVLEEPHHNTYDIEYWGPDGHCSSFYLGALSAAVKMGEALNDDVSNYEDLLKKGKQFFETELYNGEYFYQIITTEGLDTKFEPLDFSANGKGYEKIVDMLNREGPKYQYGKGCLSDGILGLWIARVCGLGEIIDSEKVKSHLNAVYKYNLERDLSDHHNPQRPAFALGKEGGLLLCTWPNGGALSIPFVYSDEVWTGIEYQVASHLMFEGKIELGLDVVRVCRDRYDGTIRNPFDEYECGHWYARALSSYGLIQGLTGIRYDAVEKTLYIDSKIGNNFRSFLATFSGFGTVGLKDGKPFVEVKMGSLDVEHVLVSGKEMTL
ncbi:MAG TPA: GH116 family glycosyl hydrolase [Candidatus Heimdallarchaeota archaeon]|nr:GH116 family glycosyl hydrolase [Candidatus Heimdallarchaeota archaeon]